MRVSWEVKVGDIIQALILATIILGGIFTSYHWKVETQDRLNFISTQVKSFESQHVDMQKYLESINTRLARIEGKIGVDPKEERK